MKRVVLLAAMLVLLLAVAPVLARTKPADNTAIRSTYSTALETTRYAFQTTGLDGPLLTRNAQGAGGSEAANTSSKEVVDKDAAQEAGINDASIAARTLKVDAPLFLGGGALLVASVFAAAYRIFWLW